MPTLESSQEQSMNLDIEQYYNTHLEFRTALQNNTADSMRNNCALINI